MNRKYTMTWYDDDGHTHQSTIQHHIDLAHWFHNQEQYAQWPNVSPWDDIYDQVPEYLEVKESGGAVDIQAQ